MKLQTKTRHTVQTIRAAAVLAMGIALCIWLGGNMNTAQYFSEESTLSNQTMLHLIAMPMIDVPATHAKKTLAIPGIEDKFVIGLEKENSSSGDRKTKTKQGRVRVAIYQIPNVKSSVNKQIQSKEIVT